MPCHSFFFFFGGMLISGMLHTISPPLLSLALQSPLAFFTSYAFGATCFLTPFLARLTPSTNPQNPTLPRFSSSAIHQHDP